MIERFVGIDVGAETIKVAEVLVAEGQLHFARHELVAHDKDPVRKIGDVLRAWDWPSVTSAVATGRLGRQLALTRIPTKQALVEGYRFVNGQAPATIVSIGSRGLSALELRATGEPVYRESSRCAQGTGNFLRQLVERFGLDVGAAASMCASVTAPIQLSSRCPVILKTDITHLANKGERRDRILAGLFDAIAESAEALVKPRRSPGLVLLTGGVSRAPRIREHFRTFLERHEMQLHDANTDAALVLEAIGCAVHAARSRPPKPPLVGLVRPARPSAIEILPALRTGLARVTRMAGREAVAWADLVLGFDIGSTGSKAVALDLTTAGTVWQEYVATSGDPIGAAQHLMRDFLDGPAGTFPVRGLGVTGSGREIVGSLMSICFGARAVFVLNEIAAHARGASHYDARVDTIFEIGGQDAKYIRLAHGHVIDAAMNEACSAGTGSFIEEQGRRFEGVPDVLRLSDLAMSADGSADLGQHCSIFMAEAIDEATAAGVPRDQIIAGLYEAVVQNYLHRVKGNRPVGEVIFCQGMPFASDALAAAVARQTGSEVVVPPNPGTVGALGIALLACEAMGEGPGPSIDVRRFLDASVESKDSFVCGAVSGCGGAGNKCRIERLTTCLSGERRRFTWGGNCSLYDKGTRRARLPDGAPNPFRGRSELVEAVASRLSTRRGGRRISVCDDFQLKGLFPLFATFLYELGFDLHIPARSGREALKRGIETANVPWCAPMQQYHGAIAALADGNADFIFAPMIREIPRVATERASQLCPVVQASADVLRWDLGAARERIVSPVVDVGPGPLDAPALAESCRKLARQLGCRDEHIWRPALQVARAAQLAFDARLLELGRDALACAVRAGVVPVVVLGRTYTIHDDILNSNIPAILRDQGALAIPLDCYPVGADVPLFENMYWGYGQRILRAAWQIRRAPGVYAVLASNYSCGPDSLTHPLVHHVMEGKPFVVIETDGHTGDAGTKTRIEAFLHCVREHRAAEDPSPARAADRLTVHGITLPEIAAAGEHVLIPTMGEPTEVFAAALRGRGISAEVLPEPNAAALRLGRRHTSGKECLPMILTLGTLLQRLERERDSMRRFAFVMPGTDGPCRFGAYKEMHQLVLDRIGWQRRVRIWSPPFGDYFDGAPPGLGAIVLAGVIAMDILRDMRHDVRPRETYAGATDALYRRFADSIARLVERASAGDTSGRQAIWETVTGRIWGLPALVATAAADLAAIRTTADLPLVLVTGEIYLRNVPASNGDLVTALEQRGLRVRVAAVSEFLQYSDFIGARLKRRAFGERIDTWVRRRIERVCHAAAAPAMRWPMPPPVREIVRAAAPWVRDALEGESVLTVGASVQAWRAREVDGVVVVGPLECMPNKIAEAQLVHVGEVEGLLSLTLSMNGEPVDTEALDGFALEVHARHAARGCARREPSSATGRRVGSQQSEGGNGARVVAAIS